MQYRRLGNTAESVPLIGQGTMGIGGYFTPDLKKESFYVSILKDGIAAGMNFIDTAESYGQGHSEELVGRAISGRRKGVFVATKVSPEHLSMGSLIGAAEASLRRLNTDYIDLYQIHWPNPAIPIEETYAAMRQLVESGKVRYTGVSNLSLPELINARKAFGADAIVSAQNEYNLFDRTIEDGFLPYCQQNEITLIAYSPLDSGRVSGDKQQLEVLARLAQEYQKTPAQIVLRWLIQHPAVMVIPKSASPEHLLANAACADFSLSAEDFALIDRTFRQTCITIPPERIKVDDAGRGEFVPTVEDLARGILAGIPLKPIRVVKYIDTAGDYDYKLVEGRVRYLAHLAAYGGKKPILALLRQSVN